MSKFDLYRKDERSKYTLSWYKLSVSVKKKTEDAPFWKKATYKKVEILNDISGAVSSSTLLAIMGPSGAGKSTLLATIACRLTEMVRGDIRLNGQFISSKLMKEISGFMPQHDLAFEYITVLEHLNFVAAMKMDRRLRASDRLRKVYSLMTLLGLNKSASTYLVNISGGERQRVALAAQMLIDPLIMFCDEPTSGLDSYSASNIVQTLQKLARSGKIVICTIHQPASNVFELFDEVMLISQGKVAYQGPIPNCLMYFSRLNMKCPMNYNIAEFLVSKISTTSQQDYQVQMLCQIFELSEDYKKIDQKIKSAYTTIIEENRFAEFFNVKHATSWMKFWHLLYRRILESIRNSKEHISNFVGCLVIGLTLALIYYKHGIKDQKSIQDIQGLIFLLLIELIFQFAYYVVFCENERSIVLKEINDGLYTVGPYFLSQMVLKIMYTCVEPIIYGWIVYYYTDIFNNIPFILYSIVLALTSTMAVSYGTCLSYTFDSLGTLTAFTTIYEGFAYLSAGTNINLNSLSPFFQCVKYVSFMFYSVESMSILQWTHTDYIPCENDCNTNCVSTGLDALMIYGYRADAFSFDVAAMIIITVILNVIAYLILWMRTKEQLAY